jgi:hypothetical protein
MHPIRNDLEELCAKRAVAPVSTDYLGFKVPQPVDTVRLVQKLQKFGVEFHDSSTKFKSVDSFDLEVGPAKGLLRRLLMSDDEA